MPFYEFECKNCNCQYEELCNYDPSEKYKDVMCPKCKSKKKNKLVSAAIVKFANPKDTSKFDSFEYRAGYNMEKAQNERRKAQETLTDGIPPYSTIDDISAGDKFGTVK